MTSPSPRRTSLALALAALVVYEGYAFFVKRSGETSFQPPLADIQRSPEIAGLTTLQQTFVMHADGVEQVRFYAHPVGAAPTGDAELMLLGDTYGEPVARRTLPAAALVASQPFVWEVPRVNQSAGLLFTLRIALPNTPPGQGVTLDLGAPLYGQGDLTIGGRSFWGDLRFDTRASRARLIDSLADLRRQAPWFLQSDFVAVLALVLLNAAIALVVLRLGAPSHTSRS